MNPVTDGGGGDWEVLKWAVSAVTGAVGGIIAAAIAIGTVVFKVNRTAEDLETIKSVLFKSSGGLNVMTESKHTEVCENTFVLWGKDFNLLQERFHALEGKVDDMADKLDAVLDRGQSFARHSEDLTNVMRQLMEKLGK